MSNVSPAFARIRDDARMKQADALMALRWKLWAVCTEALQIQSRSEGEAIDTAASTIAGAILDSLECCESVRLDLEYALGMELPKTEFSRAEFERQETLRELLT